MMNVILNFETECALKCHQAVATTSFSALNPPQMHIYSSISASQTQDNKAGPQTKEDKKLDQCRAYTRVRRRRWRRRRDGPAPRPGRMMKVVEVVVVVGGTSMVMVHRMVGMVVVRVVVVRKTGGRTR